MVKYYNQALRIESTEEEPPCSILIFRNKETGDSQKIRIKNHYDFGDVAESKEWEDAVRNGDVICVDESIKPSTNEHL